MGRRMSHRMVHRVLVGLLVAVTLAVVVQSWRLNSEQGRRAVAETGQQAALQRVHDVEQRAKTLMAQVDVGNAEQAECAAANASNVATIQRYVTATAALRDETLRLNTDLERVRQAARQARTADDEADRALEARPDRPSPDELNAALGERGAGWLWQ